MLKFEKRATQSTTLKTLGTVSEFVGVGGSYAPSSDRNLRDESKRVSILLTNAEGATALVNCSRPVSADLRSKKLKLEDLGSLNILELPQYDDEGNPVMVVDEATGEAIPLVLHSISYNGGTDRTAVTVSVTEKMLTSSSTVNRSVNWNELIAI